MPSSDDSPPDDSSTDGSAFDPPDGIPSAPDLPSPGSDGGRSLVLPAVALVLLALALGVGWYVRPWLHWLVYGIYVTPTAWIGIPLAVVVAVVVARRFDLRTGGQAGVVVLVFTFVVLSGVAGTVASENLGKATMSESAVVDELPATDPENPRIVTRAVSRRYASNTLDFPQFRIAGGDITVSDGTPYWSYALAPDGAWNHFTRRQHGTVLVDMTRQNAEVRTVTGDLSAGIGTAFYNNYRWHSLKRGEYLVDYADPFMVVDGGEQYIAVPYVRPNFHLTPVPHTTPEWAGVLLVDSDGTMQDLSPAEARENAVLADQKLYPFELARQRVAATKYRNGIVNTFTSHEDEIEVAPVPGEGNDQPFYVQTTEGPEYVVAVEPYGEAQGLKEVWLVDARTGEYRRFSPNASLFGPRKATDYVRQAARTTDWDRFTPAEPIPVVVDDTLYWEVRVVPRDGSGIAYVAFVNARTSDVRELSGTRAVSQFLRGQAVTPGDGGNGTAERQPALVVQRVAENGTVIGTMEVYGNETIRVVQGENATEDGG